MRETRQGSYPLQEQPQGRKVVGPRNGNLDYKSDPKCSGKQEGQIACPFSEAGQIGRVREVNQFPQGPKAGKRATVKT